MLGISGLVRLTKDAEVKVFGERKVINMTIICSNRVKRGDEWKDEPVSIDCHHWVHKNSTLDNFLKKGQQIFVNGHLAQETWMKEEVRQYKLVAEISTVELAGKNDSAGGTATESSKPAPTKKEAPAKATEPDAGGEDEDEIPF